jgi:hypothetical protein
VTALKMSKIVAGHKVPLRRGEIKEDMACRKCCIQNKTLGHSLSQCIRTKKERIKRHDRIKRLHFEESSRMGQSGSSHQKTHTLIPRIEVPKPDLVIENQEGVFVVEVTVCHEDGTISRRRGRVS